jgi:GNAT superfamily N-acetyltransferase
VVLARRDGVIVGVGAIKRVRVTYAKSVGDKSCVTFPADTHELGYVAVHPNHQGKGLSHRIVRALLTEYQGRLFATTSSERMKHTLKQAGFVQKGKGWKGRTGTLSFWERT